MKYRKKQPQHVISATEKDKSKCGSLLLKDINVLEAIYWIGNAWKDVETSTITKCFERCGFQDVCSEATEGVNGDDDNADDSVPLSILIKVKGIFWLLF